MCRSCLVSDGYLVVPSAEMDVFLGLGHLEQVRKAEKKFVAMARAFWATMKFLCPPHPGAMSLAHDGHPEIYYHGALRATCRLEIRDLRPQDYLELRRDAPKCLIDVAFAHFNYCTNEMMQKNEGVVPWDRELLAPRLDLPACKWSIDFWHRGPRTMQEAIYTFTSLREFNLLRSAGFPVCPLPEDCYPIRYYGAYGEFEGDGVMKMEDMDEDNGFCVYRAEGWWMYGHEDEGGWVDGDFDVADYPNFSHEELARLRASRGTRMGLDGIANSAADAYFRMVGGRGG
jgi:hypothetical protein